MNKKIRTFEELEKDNFENLTYGELCNYGLDCENYCPLYGEFCSGGMSCYGCEPIEPPCCGFNDDIILQDVYTEWLGGRLYEQHKEDEKEEKSRIRKQKYKEYKSRNWNDLYDIKIINKKIRKLKKQLSELDKLSNYAIAVNMTNQMFRECGCDCPNDLNTDRISKGGQYIQDEITKYQKEVEKIKQNIKLKEKQFKQKQKEEQND